MGDVPGTTPGPIRELPQRQNEFYISVLDRNIDFGLFNHDKKILKNDFKKERTEKSSKEAFSKTLSIILKDSGKLKKTKSTVENVEKRFNKFYSKTPKTFASVEFASICKQMACINFLQGKEIEGVCNLVASHATCLRQSILYRNMKKRVRNVVLREPIINGLSSDNLETCSTNLWNSVKLKSVLKELPSEWYIVQITATPDYINHERRRLTPNSIMYSMKPMHDLHISILPTGKTSAEPICITLPKPSFEAYDIRKEIETLLNSNKSDLSANYSNHDKYWKMREKQNERMKKAITEFEFTWLREWRVLLLADYIENLDLVKEIDGMIEKLVKDEKSCQISSRSMWLLKKIALGGSFLKAEEVERAVKYVLPTQKKLAKNIILSIVAKSKNTGPLMVTKRNVTVLILDESMEILKYQPVTRFPSLHIAKALFDEHKDQMVKGYKIINATDDLGTFIVNPSMDLPKMEMRIKAFLGYWLPQWKGQYSTKLEPEYFKKCLTQNDIVMYNGHGSGVQFLRMEEIEKMRVLASILLFGCGSLKLLPLGGRYQTFGVAYLYLTACSPCMLGMLWEVTDCDIDLMTAHFMSSWIPSKAEHSWKAVIEKSWCQGTIEFSKYSHLYDTENETDMLVAVAKAKEVCKQFMTSAAIVVRGLPIKLNNGFARKKSPKLINGNSN